MQKLQIKEEIMAVAALLALGTLAVLAVLWLGGLGLWRFSSSFCLPLS
jgi:hypothetical protein